MRMLRELKSDRPPTLLERLVRTGFELLRRVVPQRKPQAEVAHPPDLPLGTELREQLPFLFSNWGAQIVKSRQADWH
jgi:hypothetical protein